MLFFIRNKAKRLGQQLLLRAGLNKQHSQSLSSIPLVQRLKVALFAALALWMVAFCSLFIGDQYHGFILLASMGASAVLLFGLPSSPLAQPWSFVGGHLIPAAVGVTCALFIQDIALLAATTIGLTILCMYTFECIHPPGGATALVPVFAAFEQPLGYDFLLYPVASGVLILLLLSLLYRRWVLREPLSHPEPSFDPKHHSQNPPPLKRHGLQAEDLLQALNSADRILDISEQDLEQLYARAQAFAYTRNHEALTCAAVMSSKVITVAPNTPIAAAWQLLKKHKVSTLPVLEQGKLVGIISSVDFLKNLKVDHYFGLLHHLNRLLLERKGRFGKKRKVAELMIKAPNIIVAKSSDHLASIIPLLSDAGYHQLPVVDEQNRLLGIITQSDVIAALYNQNIRVG